MKNTAGTWNSICNYSTKAGFAIEISVNEEEEDENDHDWKELQGKVDCPMEFHNFTRYINVDNLE